MTTGSASAIPITVYEDRYKGDVREADKAVTPADLSAKGPDAFEPDDTSDTAHRLKVGSSSEDHTLHSRLDHDWYKIAPGLGYLRIGACIRGFGPHPQDVAGHTVLAGAIFATRGAVSTFVSDRFFRKK